MRHRRDQPGELSCRLGVSTAAWFAFILRLELLDGGLLVVKLLVRGRVGLCKIGVTLEVSWAFLRLA